MSEKSPSPAQYLSFLLMLLFMMAPMAYAQPATDNEEDNSFKADPQFKLIHLTLQQEDDAEIATPYETEEAGTTRAKALEEPQFRVSVAGILNQTVEMQGRANNLEEKQLTFGGGVLVEGMFPNITRRVTLESGVLYLKRTYRSENQAAKLIQASQRLHIPLLARYQVIDNFSIGLGPYAAIQMGETENIATIGNVALGGVSTSAGDDLEFGVDAAATVNIPVGEKAKAFIEGRYSFLFGKEANESADQFLALAGVTFDFGT